METLTRSNVATQPVLYKDEERDADVSVSIEGDDTVTTLTIDGKVIYQARFSGAAIHPDKSPEQVLDNLVRDYRTFAFISYELGNYIEFTDEGEARAPATTEKTSF
jgi:hypothetical protein